MKLAIEYLIRTGAIREFFKAPCSLCFYHSFSNEKMIVTIEEFSDCPSLITQLHKVKHYHLNEVSEFPLTKEYVVSDIFDSDKVILQGYYLIPYRESVSNKNSYSHPVDEFSWHNYTNQILNSENHVHFRKQWLWSVFRDKVLNLKEFDSYFLEQTRIRKNDQPAWRLWTEWKLKMLMNSSTASELIFLKLFPTKKIILPSSF